MYNVILWKKVTEIVAYVFTLLLAHFASKLVNNSGHSEISNSQENSKLTSFSIESSDFAVFKLFSKTHCAFKC